MLHVAEGGAFTRFDSDRNTHGRLTNVWSSRDFTVFKICVNNRSVSPGDRVGALILLKSKNKRTETRGTILVSKKKKKKSKHTDVVKRKRLSTSVSRSVRAEGEAGFSEGSL